MRLECSLRQGEVSVKLLMRDARERTNNKKEEKKVTFFCDVFHFNRTGA
jgi:hypothetical protein